MVASEEVVVDCWPAIAVSGTKDGRFSSGGCGLLVDNGALMVGCGQMMVGCW